MAKLKFQRLHSSVSHNPSEIIFYMLIWCLRIISYYYLSMLKTVMQVNIFAETKIHFFQDSLNE